jgi:hypothetical protein
VLAVRGAQPATRRWLTAKQLHISKVERQPPFRTARRAITTNDRSA